MRLASIRFFLAFCVLTAFINSALGQTKAFDTTRMDTTADACTDFFQYANGNWLKTTEIPASESSWGSFNSLRENNTMILKTILEEASAKTNAARGSDDQLIGDYFATCMDEAGIEKLGIKPIEPYLKQIAGIKDTKGLQAEIAALHAMGIGAAFGFGGGPDAKNSKMNIAGLRQGGTSLPNKDYYTKTDPKSVETRAKFTEYVTNIFKLLGDSPADAATNALTVMTIQTRFANASKAPTELRNPEASYHKMTVAQVQEMTPNFSWADYMKARNIPAVNEINVGQPDFMVEFNKMVTDVPIDQWKTYLRWMLVSSSAGSLPKAFADESFNFQGKFLSGTKEQQPRWKRCANATDGALGEALGQEYIKRNFTPEAKKRMSELIDNLFAVYRERIDALDWMSAETKEKALVKLNAYKRKIGGPDVLRGYKGLTISRASYLENQRNLAKFNIARNNQEIGKAVDQTRFGMTPPTVNASYSPPTNTITFPAGILQPPFFNFQADDAINYGAIGAVIGHEISHGFDDQGSQYDADGNLKSWWTPEDRAKFEDRVSCVADQFTGYQVQPNLNINGRLTLGENVADLGGLTVAYQAWQKAMQGKPSPGKIDGFTPEQRFYLGWAQVWAGKYTPEAERLQVLGNPHALPRWRVNGPLSNLPQFAQAFGCRAPSPMIRANACKIW